MLGGYLEKGLVCNRLKERKKERKKEQRPHTKEQTNYETGDEQPCWLRVRNREPVGAQMIRELDGSPSVMIHLDRLGEAEASISV